MSQPQTARQYQGGRPADRYFDHRYRTSGNDEPASGRYPGRGSGGGPSGPRRTRTRGPVIATVVAGIVAGAVLGLAGAEWYSSQSDTSTQNAATPAYTVEQIASKVNCRPQEGGKNSEYRQAACTVGGHRFTILTFGTEKNMQVWMTEAEGYGGAQLVGTRWLVVANTADQLDPLADKLGGAIVDNGHH